MASLPRRLARLPARSRLTLAFAAAMAALLAGIGVGLYAAVSAALLDELDTGLRSRAATVEASLAEPGFTLGPQPAGLVEQTEAFVQILRPDGTVADSTPGLTGPALPAGAVAAVTGPRFWQAAVAGVPGTARILALPARRAGRPVIAVVGASMSDRADALHLLTAVLAVAGPVSLAAVCGAGWLVAGAALRPVERMRREAAAISASEPDRRLSLPEADDELHRLAATLNQMLTRLEHAARAERRFLDNASHELRTPLTILKTELDLALSRRRSPAELLAALRSASAETDRLTRMADDLLLLSRARHGRLPVRRSPTRLRPLLTAAAQLFGSTAAGAGVTIRTEAPDTTVHTDPARIRQAIDNLLDNAIRYAPPGTTVTLHAHLDADAVTIAVQDAGPGFPAALIDRPPVPFTPDGPGAGLGLAIVHAIARSHGGSVTIQNPAGGGARVALTIPLDPQRGPP